MKTKSLGHGVFKCPFSQVERDWDLQKTCTPTPLPKKKTMNKLIVIT
jgi:hypothetical protein